MASSSSNAPVDRIRASVPARALLGIEHPCYVVNAERGVQMLGGPLAIACASASNSDCIECFLRPDDALSHPLFGVRASTPGLLLKITRRRRSSISSASPASGVPPPADPTGEGFAAEVVGTVSLSYRFEGLADYQYVTDASLRAALDARPRAQGEPFDLMERLSSLQANTLHIPPALFSMHDTPLDYLPGSQKSEMRLTADSADAPSALTKAPGASRGAPGRLAPRRRRSRTGRAVPMHFGQRVDFATEPSPLAPPEPIARTIDPDDELFVAIKAKFAQRPVWSRQALRASLPPTLYLTEERLRFRLPQLAYYFSQGPWRMCWISFGYDPRKSPDARIFQVLDMRLPNEFEHLVPKKSERSRIGAPARIRRGAVADTSDGVQERAGGWELALVASEAADGGDEVAAEMADGRGLVPGDQFLPTQRALLAAATTASQQPTPCGCPPLEE